MTEEGEASANRKKIPRGFEAVAMAEEGVASVSRKKIRLFSSDHEIEESSEGVPDAGPEEEDEGESQGNAGEHLESDGDEFVVEEEEEVDLGIEEAGSAESASPLVRTGDSAVTGVTVADADALECGVCFLALRPPIFQCELGHVVCSCCRDKLEATGNGGECCHVCGVGVATRGGYRRCHAMERLVDSIRVPCPYAAHGCVAMPAYHGRERHRRACPHAPCHCPGEACGFIGSAAALLDHFATAHDWPCTTKVRAGETFSVRLRDGFNFLLLADGSAAGDDDHGDTDTTSSVVTRLFLVNVTQERLGRAISVLWIHPPAAAAAADGVDQPLSAWCKLVFSRYDDGSLCRSHYQKSDFQVASPMDCPAMTAASISSCRIPFLETTTQRMQSMSKPVSPSARSISFVCTQKALN